MSDFDREPCFWTSTQPGYNTRDRQRSYMKDGKRVTERFPQRGHAGDYEDRRRAPGTRYVRLIDHHGFEVFHTLTNAAAHLDPTAPFGQYMMAKARHFGWYMPGACPCALLTTGEMKPGHIVDRSLIGQPACAPGSYSYENPCKHALSERVARMEQNKKVQDEREFKMKNVGVKHLEATQALTEQIGAALAPLLEAKASKK